MIYINKDLTVNIKTNNKFITIMKLKLSQDYPGCQYIISGVLTILRLNKLFTFVNFKYKPHLVRIIHIMADIIRNIYLVNIVLSLYDCT